MAHLPRHGDFVWEKDTGKTPNLALIIGSQENSEGDNHIIARLVRQNQSYKVQYSAKPKSRSTSAGQSIGHEAIIAKHNSSITTKLKSPFAYLKDDSERGRQKFATLVRWYFMDKGLVPHQDDGSMKNFYSSFLVALKEIGNEMEMLGEPVADVEAQDTIAQGTEDAVSRQAENQVNHRTSESRDLVGKRQPQPLSSTEERQKTDEIEHFRGQVSKEGLEGVLGRIPLAEQMDFSPQADYTKYVSQRLRIGAPHEDGSIIYAYLSSRAVKFEVDFVQIVGISGRSSHSSSSSRLVRLPSQELGGLRYTLLPPFNLIYKEKRQKLDEEEVVRLKTMITWYFIVKGISKDVVDDSEYTPSRRQNYARELIEALRFIESRLRDDNESPAREQPPRNSATFTQPVKLSNTNATQNSRSSNVVDSRSAPPHRTPSQPPSMSSPNGTRTTANGQRAGSGHRDAGSLSAQLSRTTSRSTNGTNNVNGHYSATTSISEPGPISQSPSGAIIEKPVSSTPQGTKRTAQDDIFHQHFEATMENQRLSEQYAEAQKELNDLVVQRDNQQKELSVRKDDIDKAYDAEKKKLIEELNEKRRKDIENADLEGQNYINDWEIEHDSAMQKAASIKANRSAARKRIKLLLQRMGSGEEDSDADA